MAEYSFSKLADQDLENIAYHTTLNFGEEQARAYQSSIFQTASLLANFPSMGISYTTKTGKQFQKFNVGEHALFYRIHADDIIIVRVLHLRTDFDKHMGG